MSLETVKLLQIILLMRMSSTNACPRQGFIVCCLFDTTNTSQRGAQRQRQTHTQSRVIKAMHAFYVAFLDIYVCILLSSDSKGASTYRLPNAIRRRAVPVLSERTRPGEDARSPQKHLEVAEKEHRVKDSRFLLRPHLQARSRHLTDRH